jgi:hypothetical protein
VFCDCVGNLPAFGKNQVSPKKFQSEVDQALRDKPAPFRTGNPNSLFGGAGGVPSAGRAPSLKADDKTAGKKNKKRPQEDLPKDTPAEFVCQLTHRLMSEPVKTVYGNVYDKTAIVNWLNTQGKICPLTGDTTCSCVLRRCVLLCLMKALSLPTGAPLAEADLIPCEELGKEIKKWILLRSTGAPTDVTPQKGRVETTAGTSGTAASNDDLYDF